MKFTKMEGLGNDYIYIDLTREKIENIPSVCKKLCDRHFGIGSDGIITIDKSSVADYKMNIYNVDGTEAKMCGNGIRCVGKYLYDNKLTRKKEINIETLSGIKKLYLKTEYDIVKEVTVDMGIAKTLKTKIVEYNNTPYEVEYVTTGNMHAVIFLKEINDKIVNELAPIIQEVDDVNVEFVKVLDKNNLFVRVYERGSKETLACGTGATASAYVYFNKERINKVNVNLLGGKLVINTLENKHLLMTGPANKIYDGVL